MIIMMALVIFGQTIMIVLALRYMVTKDHRIASALDLIDMGEPDDAARVLRGEMKP